jgi:hypothetical protein
VTDQSRDLVQGTLEMLVLKTLALEPMHGYGIALRIVADQRRRLPRESRFAFAGPQPHGTRRPGQI